MSVCHVFFSCVEIEILTATGGGFRDCNGVPEQLGMPAVSGCTHSQGIRPTPPAHPPGYPPACPPDHSPFARIPLHSPPCSPLRLTASAHLPAHSYAPRTHRLLPRRQSATRKPATLDAHALASSLTTNIHTHPGGTCLAGRVLAQLKAATPNGNAGAPFNTEN